MLVYTQQKNPAVIIDSEFKGIIEPLTDEEYKLLEANICEWGCRDALVVWAEHNILIDGHNRFEICSRHNIPYQVNEIKLDNRQEVTNWIIDNQLGRRNLTSEQQSYLRGKRYNLEKAQHGGDRKSESRGKSFPLIGTAERLADQFKVSDRTIKNDARFASAVDVIAVAVGGEVRREILSRDSKFTRQDTGKLALLAEQSPESAEAALNAIRARKGSPRQLIEAALITVASDREEQEETGEVQDGRGDRIRQVSEQIRLSPPPFPNGRFDVIAIDPPWKYSSRQDDPTHRGRPSYPTMSIEEIIALPIPELTEETCILWLWATNSFLPAAFQCLQAWGFEHKTILTWVKTQMGLGDWLRNQSEHCILGIKGQVQSFSRSGRLNNQTTILYAPRREHSRKPDEFFELVEELCPGSKLELFGRQSRLGWIVHGAEADFFDN